MIVLVNFYRITIFILLTVSQMLCFYCFEFFVELHKWQIVLQLPMDRTVLLNFAELFHCSYICVGSWIL